MRPKPSPRWTPNAKGSKRGWQTAKALPRGSPPTSPPLAGLLARDSAMRAERRVAEAALDAAKAQSGRAQAEETRLAAQLTGLGDGAEYRAALGSAEARATTAATATKAAEAALADAESGRAGAVEQRDSAETGLASARAALAAVEAEHAALVRALDHGRLGSALATIAADPGFERALAAALGDDLEADIGGEGARRWEGSHGTDDPPLAPGLTPLIAHVRASPELHRRLAQIGVAETDHGQRLVPGQRLVTGNGRVRRWDGFVTIGGGAAAAERLVRANRLAALDADLPGLTASVDAAKTSRDDAATAVDTHRAAAEQARAASGTAERDARDAARSGDTATAALERLDAQREALAERRSDLAPVLAAVADAVSAAEETLAALPDAANLGTEIDFARSAATHVGEAMADKRAEASTRARETASARERLATAARDAGDWRRRASVAEARLADTTDRARAFADEQAELAPQPDALAADVTTLEARSTTSETATHAAAGAEREAEDALAAIAKALTQAGEAFADARERRAGAVARAENQELRRREYAAISGEKFECSPSLLPEQLGFDAATLAHPDEESTALDRLTAERERLGPVNLVAEAELAEIESSRATGVAERDEIQEAIHRLRGSIGNLNREGRTRLLDAFTKVDTHFSSLFITLFDGGQSHLELVESDDPLEAGLEIMAQPPGKRLTALTLLSGGEQALTAVALIFALFLTNPAPICVLDEVDAPLDDANVERFCDLLDRMTGETDTRYLIVTHNAVTMSRMHRLYGVTMIEKGVSRLVSVDLQAAENLLAAE
jgi:chromosome segregation protein